MAEPTAEQKVEYLKTAALIVGPGANQSNPDIWKTSVHAHFDGLVELHKELIKP